MMGTWRFAETICADVVSCTWRKIHGAVQYLVGGFVVEFSKIYMKFFGPASNLSEIDVGRTR